MQMQPDLVNTAVGHRVDLTIRSEADREQIATEISFVSSRKRSPERAAITLHEELAIAHTWRVNSMWFICSAGRSGAKNAMVMLV
jgi:hypothetical protein